MHSLVHSVILILHCARFKDDLMPTSNPALMCFESNPIASASGRSDVASTPLQVRANTQLQVSNTLNMVLCIQIHGVFKVHIYYIF